MNPFLATDGYKTGHHLMYPKGTSLVYSNFTPRSDKHFPDSKGYIISFGQQMIMRQIKGIFDAHFFGRNKEEVLNEIKSEYQMYLGSEYDISHIARLHDLGYLPIHVKAIEEGSRVPIRVPVLTIYNTLPDFYWITNFLETLISNLLWKPITSATIADAYRRNLLDWAKMTDIDNIGFVDFQGHDFSMRGLSGVDSVIQSGLGHATSFLGSDSLPVIYGARKFYDEDGFVVGSVNATEHSVMCAGGASNGEEIETFRRLMETFPTGPLSVVSDTWDLWKVCTDYLPALKSEIMGRDGTLVIRPDSGDPVDIICGKEFTTISKTQWPTLDAAFQAQVAAMTFKNGGLDSEYTNFLYGDIYYEIYIDDTNDFRYRIIKTPEVKGVIELLWETFGGTTNEQGYKVLDSHIGAIYGDSITLARAQQICSRLESKGFASTNVVLGIGSFTYQHNTRDTLGMAMKATYVEIKEVKPLVSGNTKTTLHQREIFKDPVTDDGVKKSAKGLLHVHRNASTGDLELTDQVNWLMEAQGELQTIFVDGNFRNITNLASVRKLVRE